MGRQHEERRRQKAGEEWRTRRKDTEERKDEEKYSSEIKERNKTSLTPDPRKLGEQLLNELLCDL